MHPCTHSLTSINSYPQNAIKETLTLSLVFSTVRRMLKKWEKERRRNGFLFSFFSSFFSCFPLSLLCA